MAHTHSLLTAVLAVGFLTILGYCAISFTNAVNDSVRHATVAAGTLTLSSQQLGIRFETQQVSPHHAQPPVQIVPSGLGSSPALPPRSVQRHR
jgi:hypothetical protein